MVDEQLIRAFDTMRCGVYIVTSAYRRKPAGCTVVWVSRASFTPPLICVHLAPNGHTLETISRGKRFCVNILGESGSELAREFGFTSGHGGSKFEDVLHRMSAGGSPILEAAVAYVDCKLLSIELIGDHYMLVGEVIDAAVQTSEEPLVYDPDTFYTTPAERVESLERLAEQS